LTRGTSGQFDVIADGRIVFSKKQAGRFPLEGEVEGRIEKLLAGGDVDSELSESAAGKGVLGKIISKLRG
jgi:predicted Rdx family selenoprotein